VPLKKNKMRKIIVTLSFGENYTRDYTLRLIDDVINLSNCELYITTDQRKLIESHINNDRIKIFDIDRDSVKIRIPVGENKYSDDFNFNMRYISLEPVKNINDSLIIFTDCDNSFDWWDETEVDNFINEHYHNNGYDFFAPRNTYKWKDFVTDYSNRTTKEHGIFWHKIYNYDLDDNKNIEWADCPLPAEYLLIFVNNNNKLSNFVSQWKWFYDYLNSKEYSYGTWAEGFEIGISSCVANFKNMDIGWNHHIWSKIFVANGYKNGHRGNIHHVTERN
jgi:hypothetical protein